MKIRSCFVSNSSSASFCIGKNYMTPEQVKGFGQYCRTTLRDQGEYVDEGDYYFLGMIEQGNYEKITDKLKELGVDVKYVKCD